MSSRLADLALRPQDRIPPATYEAILGMTNASINGFTTVLMLTDCSVNFSDYRMSVRLESLE